MKKNRMSSNVMSDDSSSNIQRYGTMLSPSPGILECVEEDHESDDLEFNPDCMPDKADDEDIENFLTPEVEKSPS